MGPHVDGEEDGPRVVAVNALVKGMNNDVCEIFKSMSQTTIQ